MFPFSLPFPGDGEHPWQPPHGRRTATVPDEVLAMRVAEKLGATLFLGGHHVVVEVQNSVVILEGSVPSPDVHRRAHEIVWSVTGVFDVSNRLVVQHHPSPLW